MEKRTNHRFENKAAKLSSIKSLEIYYADLNKASQAEFDKVFGTPDKHNHETIPITSIEREE